MEFDLDKSIFLTFDIDWACDEIILDTLDLLDKQNIPATFFVTHKSPILEQLRQNPLIELGIHPNFNNILSGEVQQNAQQIITNILDIVPEAVSVRSHALTQSSNILNLFIKHGLKYDLNLLIPARSHIPLYPFRFFKDLIRVPFFWEDDVHCMDVENGESHDWEVKHYFHTPGLKVFNFHPIHVYLNTEHLYRYQRIKNFYHDADKIIQFRNDSELSGSRIFLTNLIKYAKNAGFRFLKIKDIPLIGS